MFGCKGDDFSDPANPDLPFSFSLISTQQRAMPYFWPWTQNINVDEHPATAAEYDGDDAVAPYDV